MDGLNERRKENRIDMNVNKKGRRVGKRGAMEEMRKERKKKGMDRLKLRCRKRRKDNRGLN